MAGEDRREDALAAVVTADLAVKTGDLSDCVFTHFVMGAFAPLVCYTYYGRCLPMDAIASTPRAAPVAGTTRDVTTTGSAPR